MRQGQAARVAAIVAATVVLNLVFFCPCAVQGTEIEGAVQRGNLLALATCLVATHGLAVPATAVHQQHHIVESAEGIWAYLRSMPPPLGSIQHSSRKKPDFHTFNSFFHFHV